MADEKDIKCLVAACPTCGTITAGMWLDKVTNKDIAAFYKNAGERVVSEVAGKVTLTGPCSCCAKGA